jgi:hypothetical protein
MKAPSIPSTQGVPKNVRAVVEPMKQALEHVLGRRPKQPAIAPLAADATLDEVIAKVNELIARVQA